MIRRFSATVLASVLFGAGGIRAEDDARTNAIERGAQYLKGLQKKPIVNNIDSAHQFGRTALRGLALLESGVPASDPVIQDITGYIRRNAVSQTKTYEMSLGIMYLDRLGDRLDQPAIQFLAVQLLGTQGNRGLWGYDGGDPLTEAEAERIRKALYDENRLRNANTKDEHRDPPAKEKPKNTPGELTPLHPEVVRFGRANGAFVADLSMRGDAGDHSNTQFAVLALWIARKHGVNVNLALLATDKNFRSIQKRDGGWDYRASDRDDAFPENQSTPAMTCSGLIALSVARGLGLQALRSKSATPPKGGEIADATNDRAAAAALKYLENAIAKSEKGMGLEGGSLRNNLYFLWSLERVAVIYDLEKIGSVNWYQWGADHLIRSQGEDGSWGGGGYQDATADVNTAFALLFLNRANLAKDLTATLKGKANVKLNLPDRITNPEPVKVDPKQKIDPPLTSPSNADFDKEANRLCNTLVSADASNRATILGVLRDSKGSVYTEALVRAIAKLKSEQQREAREALALRLKRMTAVTLRDMLRDENREIRSAAAAACRLKEDKQFVPDLIAVLNDADNLVVQSARSSLRGFSQKDFGPNDSASAEDKAKAIAAWRAWWTSQPK